MKTLQCWTFIFLLLETSLGTNSKEFLWRKTGIGVRFSATNSLVSTEKLSLIRCSIKCFTAITCVSFNHDNYDNCELQNAAPFPSDTTNLVSSPMWNHYTFIIPNPSNNRRALCPTGSTWIPYDVPVTKKYTPDIEGYTCMNHTWLTGEFSQGKRDCRMVLYYKTDFGGNDAANWNGKAGEYYTALRNCFANGCLGLACDATMAWCWLKTATHLSTGGLVTKGARPDRHYWFTRCQ